jgi:hypothetical protein
MSIERWLRFTRQQQNGNLSSELCRAVSYFEVGKKESGILSLYRTLDMLTDHKQIIQNKEIFHIYELIAANTIDPQIEEIKFFYEYFLEMALVIID